MDQPATKGDIAQLVITLDDLNKKFDELSQLVLHINNAAARAVCEAQSVTIADVVTTQADSTSVVKKSAPVINAYFKSMIENDTNTIADKTIILGKERELLSKQPPFAPYLESMKNKDILSWSNVDWKACATSLWNNYTKANIDKRSMDNPDDVPYINYYNYIKEKKEKEFSKNSNEKQLTKD